MKKWAIGCGIVAVILLVLCGVGGFIFYKFYQKATASQSSFDSVQPGQLRSDVEKTMGGNGLGVDTQSAAPAPQAGEECRIWINSNNPDNGFEVCYVDGKVTTKSTFATSTK